MLDATEVAQMTEIARKMVNEAMQNLVRGTGGAMIPTPLVRPGVVGADAPPGGPVAVKADGDTSPITAVNATSGLIPSGTRVLISFLPPNGVFITGTFARAYPPIGVDYIAANQTTSSNTYTNLATTGPEVTIETGESAVVTISSWLANSTLGGGAAMSYDVSGATTKAAADDTAIQRSYAAAANTGIQASFVSYFGVDSPLGLLNPGINTFTAKYKRGAAGIGTSNFTDRFLIVQPFGD
jgi:hypothetical protein